MSLRIEPTRFAEGIWRVLLNQTSDLKAPPPKILRCVLRDNQTVIWHDGLLQSREAKCLLNIHPFLPL